MKMTMRMMMKTSLWPLLLGLAVSYTAAAAPGTVHTDTCIQPLKSMVLLSVVSKLYTCCVRLFYCLIMYIYLYLV